MALTLVLTSVGAARPLAQSDEEGGDGLVHASLVLGTREISVAYPAELSPDTPSSEALLDRAIGRVRVARLDAHRSLRLGDLVRSDDEPEDDAPTTIGRDLWLTRSAAGWALEARADTPDVAGVTPVRLPLDYQAAGDPTPSLVASLVPTSDDAGRLDLAWGPHRWTADFSFDELPPRPPRERPDGVGPSQDLERDSDTTAIFRRNRLADRNESALVLPDGARIEILYYQEQAAEGEDFTQIGSAEDGDVLQLTRAAAIRIKSDVPLRFGDVLMPTENLTPGFAGMYGVWLKRVGDGWHVVFNNEPDSWGTQYDASFDAFEIPLAHGADEPNHRPDRWPPRLPPRARTRAS